MMPRAALAGFTCCLLAVCHHPGYAAEGGEDVQRILRSATDRVRSAKAFTAEFEFAVRVGPPGLEHGRFARYKIAVARPNQFLFLRTEGDMGATVASDGTRLIQYVAELGQYTDEPAPGSLDEFSTSITGMMLIEGGMGGFMMALLSDDPYGRLTGEVTDTRYLGKETINGTECHHLQLVQEEWDIDLWVTTGEAPVLRRIRPDLSRQLGEEEREMGFSITISLEYDQWNFAPDITDETFAFTPPASAEKAEALTPRTPAPVAPPVVTVHPLIGQPAPEFALVKLKGNEAFTLKDVLGKRVVVLDFWATWCPPCVEGLPQVADVAREFEGKNVSVFAVNVEEDAETIKAFLSKKEIDIPVLVDAQASVAQQYEVSGIPQTVLIGLDGRVHVVHTGLSGDMKRELTQQIQALLDGEDLAAGEREKAEGPSTDEPKDDSPAQE